MQKLYTIIPIYNEENNINQLIQSITNFVNHYNKYECVFIIVNDGSTDQTVEVLQTNDDKLPHVLLNHEKNNGPGYAFGSGFEYIADIIKPEDYVITMEGDNTSRFNIIEIMLSRSIREGLDLILASPYAYGGNLGDTNIFRSILSHFANGFVKITLGIHGIHTMSSFFRVYKGSLIKKLQKRYGKRILERSGFESMMELLMKIIALDATISEVPLKLNTANRPGKSKMKIIKTGLGYLSLWKDKSRWMSVPNA